MPVRSVDIDDHPELRRRFHVNLLPTFLVVQDSVELARFIGPHSAANWRPRSGVRSTRGSCVSRSRREPAVSGTTSPRISGASRPGSRWRLVRRVEREFVTGDEHAVLHLEGRSGAVVVEARQT